MKKEKIFDMSIGKIYPLLVNKATRKGRTKEEVDEIILWLTGYTKENLTKVIEDNVSYSNFFEQAPNINPNVFKIKGSICGIKVEEIEDPLMRNIRYLDKLIDELSKGKSMDKILRR